MPQKISKKYALSIQGVLSYDPANQQIYVSIQDKGDYLLSELLEDFDGKECNISINYNEDYGAEEDEV